MSGTLSMEASPEMIKLLIRDMGGKKYFWYQGVRVCLPGTTQEIDYEESKTLHDRMHPDSKTIIISGHAT